MHAPELAVSPLTAPALRRALIAGAWRVIAGRELLNRINVFPVADGDTGNNLASTMRSLLNGVLATRSHHAGELLQQVGDEAIDGARGNSGAILAQFLHGIAERAPSRPSLHGEEFAAAVRHGALRARQALAAPVEGTILSVIDRFADALSLAAARAPADPRAAFAQALAAARLALADTPRQMALLRRAGVVDAGARGFVDLLEGIADFLDAGPRAPRLRQPAWGGGAGDAPAHNAVHAAVDPARRWCTECLLLGDAIDRDALRAALEAADADSIVLAGGSTRLRVHAHVDRPQAVFDAAAAVATVSGMKADDMLLQSRSIAHPRAVAVVTDSAADLPPAVAAQLHIHVVPVGVQLDGRDYLDKVGLDTATFYRRMASSRQLPSTSQPAPGEFRRSFEFLAAHHAHVLYVGVSRALSGTLQSGETAAARLPAGRVQVFDSVNVSAGQALLAWRAAELAAQGAAPPAIVAELERLRPATRMWAMARDVRHAVRGGRIPAWAGHIVRLSGLTPIAAMRGDGALKLAGGLFAREQAPLAFAAYVARRVPRTTRWRVVVGHCDAAEDGARLLDALGKRLRVEAGHLVESGAAIGAHAGRRALVVALQPAPDDGASVHGPG